MEGVDVSPDLPFIIDLDQNPAAPIVLNTSSSTPGVARSPLLFSDDNWESDSDNSDVEVVDEVIEVAAQRKKAETILLKYLCASIKNRTDVGLKHRGLAMAADLSNYDAVFEYFAYTLGSRKLPGEYTGEKNSLFEAEVESSEGTDTASSSLRPNMMPSALAELMQRYAERYRFSISTIMNSPHSLAWDPIQIAYLELLSVFNYYLCNEYAEALEVLLSVYKKNQIVSSITSLDSLRDKYKWNQKLNFAAFRDWLVIEYEDILQMDREERAQMREDIAAGGGVDSDDEEDDEVGDENISGETDDPIRDMLAYLIQVL